MKKYAGQLTCLRGAKQRTDANPCLLTAETYAKLSGAAGKAAGAASKLRESYACARATFFVPGAPLELNLPFDVLDALPLPALPSNEKEAPVPPTAFADAQKQVTDMLQHSLQAFVAAHSRNAGRNRGLFAIFVGLILCAVGLAPILLSFYRDGRFLAFAALPCLWIGVGTLVAGLHGVRSSRRSRLPATDPV